MHYDNPDEEAGLTDSSGITFYATPYREHAMGTLSTGSIADGNTLQIPPGRQDHFDATACVLHADDSVQVAGNFFHAHELGTGFWTDLYRDDVKIEEIGRDHAWSFDDQRFTPMSETLMLQAGDVISTVCTFDATQHPDDGVGRTETTYGGLGTRDEMCINFIWYWPQDHNAYCLPCSHVDGSLSEDGHTIDDSGALYPDGGLDALISSGQCAHVEACNPGEGDCMCTATELWSIMDILKDEGTENEWMTGITSGCYSCLYSSEFSSECFAPQCSTTHCMCNEEDLESMALTDSNNLMPHVSDACTSCLFYSDDVFWCLPDHDTYEVPVCNIEQLIATVAAATAGALCRATPCLTLLCSQLSCCCCFFWWRGRVLFATQHLTGHHILCMLWVSTPALYACVVQIPTRFVPWLQTPSTRSVHRWHTSFVMSSWSLHPRVTA